MKKRFQILGVLILLSSICKAQITFTDSRDGNIYSITQIGNQFWMAENLRYLPSVSEANTTSSDEPHFYVYGYDGTNVVAAKATSNYLDYGVLYNWSAAMSGNTSSTNNPSGVQGICPNGWHLPSLAEWNELSTYLGGSSSAGGTLKTTETNYWNSPNTGATNSSGFSARGGGQLDSWDGFMNLRENGYWWTSTEENSFNAHAFDLGYNYIQLFNDYVAKDYGFCVRCVSDIPLSTIKNEKQIDLKIYPNPASSFITVRNLTELNSIDLQIIDITGKVLIQSNLSNNETVIDVNSLSSGVYFIIANNMEYIIRYKFIKK